MEGIGDHGDPEHLGQPWVYPGSHIRPREDGPRAGSIGLAVIPSHITADGRDDQPCDGPPWPFLRLTVQEETCNAADVLLNPAQARHLAEQLTAWADRAEPAAAADTPELTADEARALADELGTDLYRAQDALAFVGECCDIADREQRPITTGRVREWLKGAQCGRRLATDNPNLYDKISGMFGGPLPPPGDEPPNTVLPCNHTHLRQPHEPHPWQPQPGVQAVQCPGYARVPVTSTCSCGRSPDPGICPNDCGPGSPAGGHCACVHEQTLAATQTTGGSRAPAVPETTPNNPPGSTREQLPDHILDLIDVPTYTSTACETARECERVIDVHTTERPWLLAHAEELHARCRLNHKFTGALCACACHGEQPAG
jgi:hypothetical protein